MKGQFFILGAILIIGLFFIGLPMRTVIIKTPSEDLTYLSDNIQNEMHIALNLGLNESNAIGDLVNFTRFVDSKMFEHFVNFSCLWVVTENVLDDLNATVGNFLGYDTIVKLTISSYTKDLSVSDNATNSFTFLNVPSEFTMNISFDSQNYTVTWQRDKINLYVFTNLMRDEDSIKEETEG